MDNLGLEVTKPYKYLFSFDFRKVKCLALIKYLVISLAQIPSKTLVMDVVVADIPPNFGMLLSRSLAATVLVFGVQRILFREKKLAYMVTNVERPNNHPIYSLDTEMGSTIFFTEGCKASCSSYDVAFVPTQEELDGVWEVSFDGATCREGERAGVWVIPPRGRNLN